MKSDVVAFEYAIRLLRNGRRSSFTARVLAAQPDPGGAWSSRVLTRIGRQREQSFDCYGIDRLQSHLLSFVYLRARFRELRRDGFSLFDFTSDSETDPEWCFNSLFKEKG
jgi:hypothetical protein